MNGPPLHYAIFSFPHRDVGADPTPARDIDPTRPAEVSPVGLDRVVDFRIVAKGANLTRGHEGKVKKKDKQLRLK
jgi:hypothetical protein